MLFHERRKLSEIEAAEARGEYLWTEKFSPEIRTKIWYAFVDSGGHSIGDSIGMCYFLLLRSIGVPHLARPHIAPNHDLERFLVTSADDSLVPSIVEAMITAHSENAYIQSDARAYFQQTVNDVLRRGRVSFELVDHQMIPLESQQLHTEVVLPALSLLSGRPGLDGAERSYQDALRQISTGDAPNAITDVGTAVQETLEALGCDGNALAPLATSAVRKGLIAKHDKKLLDWIAASRSERGDGHHATDASVEEAWLMVHVAGALILRLATSSAQ